MPVLITVLVLEIGLSSLDCKLRMARHWVDLNCAKAFKSTRMPGKQQLLSNADQVDACQTSGSSSNFLYRVVLFNYFRFLPLLLNTLPGSCHLCVCSTLSIFIQSHALTEWISLKFWRPVLWVVPKLKHNALSKGL